MRNVLDAEQMKKVDEYTICKVGIPSMVLMERAALAVCNVIREHFDTDKRILSVCGMGNNGADAIACARILDGWGYDVAICTIGDDSKATTEWKQQYDIAQKLNLSTVTLDVLSDYDVVVDGIFGIGLCREVGGAYADAIEVINQAKAEVIAVDVPSGINATTGAVMNHAIEADFTVTFGYEKTGLLLYPGALHTGKLIVADCGFAVQAFDEVLGVKKALELDDLELLPKRNPDSNKGTYGKVLVLAGSSNMSGAAYFSAKSAYRLGAGLVRILTCKENKEVLQKLLPEAVLCFYDDMTKEDMKEQLQWANVLVAGPGLSTDERASEILYMALDLAKDNVNHILLDADALNILARDGKLEYLCNTTITPHLGEMSRLANEPIAEIKKQIITKATAFAKKWQCTCVLKDSRSIITDGDRIYINTSGNSGMATAGAGDVLTGIIAGVWANGLSGMEGTALGVYIHGLAGDCAKESMGEYFMKADDIADCIKNVIHR